MDIEEISKKFAIGGVFQVSSTVFIAAEVGEI